MSETQTVSTDLAIEAFRAVARTRRLLDRKEAELARRLDGRIDMARYYAETEKIRGRYEGGE
jgi:hypothetical protein